MELLVSRTDRRQSRGHRGRLAGARTGGIGGVARRCLRGLAASALVLAALAAAPRGPAEAQEADLVLRNGTVVTMDPSRPEATALATAGDTILAVGSDRDVEAYVGPGTRVIDLEGRLAVPGFVESHGHFMKTGEAQLRLPLLGTSSWQAVVAMVDSAARTSEPGEWILGRGWHQEKWDRDPGRTVEGFPVHDRLSEVAPENPVWLTHASGHAAIANAAAMEAAGIGPETRAPEGGHVVRDASGAATGVFVDEAEALVEDAFERSRSDWSAAERRAHEVRVARLAAREALRNGVTSFHDQEGAYGDTLRLYHRLAGAGELGVRLNAMVAHQVFSNEYRERLRDWFTAGAANHHLTVRAVGEVHTDGALGSRSAWMLEPYDDQPGHTGLEVTSVERVREIARLALEEGWQVATHAIGDRANREVLDLYAALWDSAGVDGDTLRWRIEHAQHLHPDDVSRFGELGVIASMQAIHACSDAPYVIPRLGVERAREGAYVWEDLVETGAVVTNGTDTPVEEISPIASFHCAVTRHVQGAPADSTFFPGQAMTREEALRSYTVNGAYAAFQEELLGSLEPGKLADVVVLSRDLLTVPADSIPGTEVLYTIVGGEVLYSAEEGFSGLPAPDAPVPAAPDTAAAAGREEGAADTVSFVSALREHRLALALDEGRLTGPGADLLLGEAAEARYLLFGETHGVAETPRLVAAAFRALVDDGYRHLAVEIGPVQADRIGEVMAGDRPMEAYRRFLEANWPGVPFFSWREEAELLADAVAAGGSPDVLWGVDYDILADRYPLHRLRELAPDSTAAAAADRAIAVADSLLEVGITSGDPSRVAMFSRPDSVWLSLRKAYAPEPGSEADRILFQLAATARINEAWTSDRRWLSNELRVELIKRNFLRYREAGGPDAKVVVKMGGAHLTRGRTPNNTFDLGNLLSELSVAEAEGSGASELTTSRSFHVLVLGGPGRKHAALDPETWGVRQAPTVLSEEGHWAASLGEAAHADRWTLFDLRPLRSDVSGGEFGDLPERLEETMFGYDAVIVLSGSTPARAVEVERPAFGPSP